MLGVLAWWSRARRRAHGSGAHRDWDSGRQDLLRYCLVHAAVGARSFINPLRARAASLGTHEIKSKPCGCADWQEADDASRRVVNTVLAGSWGRVPIPFGKPKPMGQGRASARGVASGL